MQVTKGRGLGRATAAGHVQNNDLCLIANLRNGKFEVFQKPLETQGENLSHSTATRERNSTKIAGKLISKLGLLPLQVDVAFQCTRSFLRLMLC